jgi:hypothetical protein
MKPWAARRAVWAPKASFGGEAGAGSALGGGDKTGSRAGNPGGEGGEVKSWAACQVAWDGTMRWGSTGKIARGGMRHPARAVATKRGHARGIRVVKGVR